MGQYNKAIITAAGESLIARAIVGEIQLSITKAKTSDYKYPGGTDLKALTDMQGIKQVMTSPETRVLSGDMIQTRTLFSNEEIQATYYIQNIGLYAMNGTQEVLFCIVTAATPDEMPQYNGVASTSYIYNIQNMVQDAVELHIVVNPSGTATIQDVLERVDATGGDISETIIKTIEPIDTKYPIPTVGEKVKTFFGKIVTFMKNIKPLEADMTVYVDSDTGSDTTGTGTSAKPYKTIQHAVDAIPRDLGGYGVTIKINDAYYRETVAITGFFNGELTLQRNATIALNISCSVIGFVCKNTSAKLTISAFNLTPGDGHTFIGENCSNLVIQYCRSWFKSTTSAGFYLNNCRAVVSGCMAEGRKWGMVADNASYVLSQNWGADSTNTDNGIASLNGSMVLLQGNQPTGDIQNYYTALDGIIDTSPGTLANDTTLYVSPTGSDETGDGTESKPFKTIQHALNIPPKNLNGKEVNILLADGTYPENVSISGFTNGAISLRRNTDPRSMQTLCRITGIQCAYNSARLYFAGITHIQTNTHGLYGLTCDDIILEYCQSIGFSGSTAGFAFDTCTARLYRCNSNKNEWGVSATFNSTVLSADWNWGSDPNKYGVCSESGSAVSCTGTQPLSSEAKYITTGSGKVFYENGTQISGIISSGLSCTWGTIQGGYVRHGNMNGTAMVTVQLRITITTPLSGGTEYTINGFPQPVITPAVTVHDNNVQYAQINNPSGTLWYRPINAVGTGYNIMMSCTYLTNS